MKTILIAEDSPTQAEHLGFILESSGYTVAVASNGREALERLDAFIPDLIISDIMMPEMDGYEFCRRVKANPLTCHIPFIILTVFRTPGDLVIGLECGADNFITKPLDEAHLLERVQRICENLELRRQGIPQPSTTVFLGDRRISVSADRHQIVELLIAVLEEMGRVNEDLVESHRTVSTYRQELATVERTRRALEQDGLSLTLYAQPILDLQQNQVSHYELLLRMVDEHGRLILPGEFLPTAEKSGMITQIDTWVVQNALRQIKRIEASGRQAEWAINLSGRSLTSPQVLATMMSELSAGGVDPQRLVFEVTETWVINNMATAGEFTSQLKAAGCRWALDDFGVGFSNFDYLRRLPLDYVKVDGSLVRNLEQDERRQHMVRAIAEVAEALGTATIAECVETEPTLVELRRLGIDYAQGYWVGRPTPLYDLVLPER